MSVSRGLRQRRLRSVCPCPACLAIKSESRMATSGYSKARTWARQDSLKPVPQHVLKCASRTSYHASLRSLRVLCPVWLSGLDPGSHHPSPPPPPICTQVPAANAPVLLLLEQRRDGLGRVLACRHVAQQNVQRWCTHIPRTVIRRRGISPLAHAARPCPLTMALPLNACMHARTHLPPAPH